MDLSRIRLGNRGFGLVSVLATATIGSIVMLAMNKMITNQVGAQRNIATKASFDGTMLQLREFLAYKDNCTTSLLPSGFPFETNSAGIPLAVRTIQQIPYSGTPTVNVGLAPMDFSVSSISLESFTASQVSSPDTFSVRLVIRGTKTGAYQGAPLLYSALPLYIQLSPLVGQKRTFISCPQVNRDCPAGTFYQNSAVGCVPPVELLTKDPTTPFLGEMWLRTDL